MTSRHRIAALALAGLLSGSCASSAAPSSSSATPHLSAAPTATPSLVRSPVARGYHALISLGDRGSLLVGGETAGPKLGGKTLFDPWLYRDGRWVAAAGGGIPPVLTDANGSGGSGRAVVLSFAFSSLDVVSATATWIYDAAADRWEQRQDASRPALFQGGRGAYDRKADRLIVLDPESGKTWAYDVGTASWIDRMAQGGPRPGPYYYALAYDEQSDRTILFGGADATTWAYDYSANTWTAMRPTKSPPTRMYHAMAYVPLSDRVILFGGVAAPAETPFADTWTYDYDTNTWTSLTSPSAPGARAWHAMAYDAPSGMVLLFGGGADRGHFQGDTWVFDPLRQTWSSVP